MVLMVGFMNITLNLCDVYWRLNVHFVRFCMNLFVHILSCLYSYRLNACYLLSDDWSVLQDQETGSVCIPGLLNMVPTSPLLSVVI